MNGTLTETPPQAEELARRLEDEIVNGKILPGTHLTEVALARQLRVSRTPLRQALTRLGNMGWIEMIPNVGCFVREVSPLDVAELYLVRQNLEGLAAELTCRRWSPPLASQLKELADTYRQHRLAEDYYQTRLANVRFHRAIVDASSCKALIDTVQAMRIILRSEVGRHPFEARLGATLARIAVTHYDILEALASGNPVRARKTAEEHLAQVRRRIVERLIA